MCMLSLSSSSSAIICLVFIQFSGIEPLNPWHFPSDRNVFGIHGGPLGPSGQGLVIPGRPTMWLQGWGFEPCDSNTISGEGKGAGDGGQSSGQWPTQACQWNETPVKTLGTTVPVSFSFSDKQRTVKHSDSRERTLKPTIGTLPDLGCLQGPQVVLLCILSNKTAILSIALLWIL